MSHVVLVCGSGVSTQRTDAESRAERAARRERREGRERVTGRKRPRSARPATQTRQTRPRWEQDWVSGSDVSDSEEHEMDVVYEVRRAQACTSTCLLSSMCMHVALLADQMTTERCPKCT